MSVQLVEHATSVGAWQLGVGTVLSAGGELSNLITTINEPCIFDSSWFTERSPHKFNSSGDDIRNVVNTIFPVKLAARATDRSNLYSMYLTRHDRAHRWAGGRYAWGTYFERLIRFPPNKVNQLERAITKLVKWKVRNTTGLVFHLSSPSIDAPRTRGGPCWQYGELLWNAGNTLDLVVTYRNHDFFNKVLGNYIGLGYLLAFICTNTGKKPGKLICHSAHAYNSGSAITLRAMAT
jgi:hypothetical protein